MITRGLGTNALLTCGLGGTMLKFLTQFVERSKNRIIKIMFESRIIRIRHEG